MSTELETNLRTILNEKETKILPENIKKDVQIFDVVGTYEGSSSPTEGIKQFSTIEEMQADINAKEGDLAVVYRSEVQNIKDGDTITSMTFPKTVIFDTAITTDYYSRLRNSTEPRIYLDMQLSSTSFEVMDMYGTIPTITYTSSDGITYTRTDTNEDTYEIGETTISGVDEHICKFIQVGGMSFDGLYEYSSYKDKTKIKLPLMSGLNIQYDSSSSTISSVTFNKEFSNEINFTKLVSVYNKFISDTSTPNKAYIYLDNNDNLKFVQMSHMLCYDKNVNFLGASVTISTDTDTTAKIYNIDLENETYTLDTELEPSGYIYYSSSYNWNYYNLDNKTIPFNIVNSRPTNFNNICIGDTASSKTSYTKYIEGDDCYVDTSSYLIAPTQLTATPDYVYEKEFYGKNGVESGTLTQDISNSFADINAEVYNKIQNQYENMEPRVLTDDDKTIDTNIYVIPVKTDGTVLLDTSNVTDMSSMFHICTNLTTIPLLNTSNATNMTLMFADCSSLTEVPLLDTSNVTNMNSMFANCSNLTEIPLLNTSNVIDMGSMVSGCTSLTTIPQFDTSNVTNIGYMFSGCTSLTEIPLLDTSSVTNMNRMFYVCTNLSDESLNNILAMCTNAIKITKNKTLAYIGLTQEQATRCQSLSNYSAFTSAGWTIGY